MAETLIFETTCSGLSSESGSPPFPNFTVDGNDLFSACRVGSAVGSFDSPSVDTLSILSGDVITLPSGKIYRVEIDSGDLTYYWSPFGNSGYDDNPIAVRVLGVKWDTGSNTNVNNFMASDEFNDNWFAPGESAIVSTPNIEAASPVNIDFGFGFDNTDFSDTGNGPISSTHTITGADYSTPFMSIRIYEVTAGVAPEFDPFPVALPNGMDNNVYSADVKPLMVVIGDPVPTFTLSTGTIPPGLTLNSDGTITGTPTTPGDYSFDIDATNSAGGSVGPFTLRITIEGTLPEFDSETVDLGYFASGTTLNIDLKPTMVEVGDPFPAFAINSGSITAGASLGSDGVITGTASENGIFSFEATASNGVGDGFGNFTMDVGNAPTLLESFEVTTPAVIGVSFGPYDLAADIYTAGDGTLTYTIDSGALPAGLSMDSAGIITGTAVDPVSLPATFFVIATNVYGVSDTCEVTLNSASTPEFDVATGSMSNGDLGSPYVGDVKPFMVVVGEPEPTFTVTAGALPSGLTLNSDGTITGTPDTPGPYDFTVEATNIAGTDTGDFSIAINAGTAPEFYDIDLVAQSPAVQVDPDTVESAGGTDVNTAYKGGIAGVGRIPADGGKWIFEVEQIANTATAPFVGGSGVGFCKTTPMPSQSIAFANTQCATFSPYSGAVIDATMVSSTLGASPSPGGDGTIITVVVDFDSNLINFYVNGVAVPGAMTITGSTGVPWYPVVGDHFAAFTYTLRKNFVAPVYPVAGAIPWAVSTLDNGDPSVAYAEDVKSLMLVTGTPEPVFSLLTGTLPDGLTLNSDGTITGTPTTPGDYNFEIEAVNAAGDDIGAFSIHVNAAPETLYWHNLNANNDGTDRTNYTTDQAGTIPADDRSMAIDDLRFDGTGTGSDDNWNIGAAAILECNSITLVSYSGVVTVNSTATVTITDFLDIQVTGGTLSAWAGTLNVNRIIQVMGSFSSTAGRCNVTLTGNEITRNNASPGNATRNLNINLTLTQDTVVTSDGVDSDNELIIDGTITGGFKLTKQGTKILRLQLVSEGRTSNVSAVDIDAGTLFVLQAASASNLIQGIGGAGGEPSACTITMTADGTVLRYGCSNTANVEWGNPLVVASGVTDALMLMQGSANSATHQCYFPITLDGNLTVSRGVNAATNITMFGTTAWAGTGTLAVNAGKTTGSGKLIVQQVSSVSVDSIFLFNYPTGARAEHTGGTEVNSNDATYLAAVGYTAMAASVSVSLGSGLVELNGNAHYISATNGTFTVTVTNDFELTGILDPTFNVSRISGNPVNIFTGAITVDTNHFTINAGSGGSSQNAFTHTGNMVIAYTSGDVTIHYDVATNGVTAVLSGVISGGDSDNSLIFLLSTSSGAFNITGANTFVSKCVLQDTTGAQTFRVSGISPFGATSVRFVSSGVNSVLALSGDTTLAIPVVDEYFGFSAGNLNTGSFALRFTYDVSPAQNVIKVGQSWTSSTTSMRNGTFEFYAPTKLLFPVTGAVVRYGPRRWILYADCEIDLVTPGSGLLYLTAANTSNRTDLEIYTGARLIIPVDVRFIVGNYTAASGTHPNFTAGVNTVGDGTGQIEGAGTFEFAGTSQDFVDPTQFVVLSNVLWQQRVSGTGFIFMPAGHVFPQEFRIKSTRDNSHQFRLRPGVHTFNGPFIWDIDINQGAAINSFIQPQAGGGTVNFNGGFTFQHNVATNTDWFVDPVADWNFNFADCTISHHGSSTGISALFTNVVTTNLVVTVQGTLTLNTNGGASTISWGRGATEIQSHTFFGDVICSDDTVIFNSSPTTIYTFDVTSQDILFDAPNGINFLGPVKVFNDSGDARVFSIDPRYSSFNQLDFETVGGSLTFNIIAGATAEVYVDNAAIPPITFTGSPMAITRDNPALKAELHVRGSVDFTGVETVGLSYLKLWGRADGDSINLASAVFTVPDVHFVYEDLCNFAVASIAATVNGDVSFTSDGITTPDGSYNFDASSVLTIDGNLNTLLNPGGSYGLGLNDVNITISGSVQLGGTTIPMNAAVFNMFLATASVTDYVFEADNQFIYRINVNRLDDSAGAKVLRLDTYVTDEPVYGVFVASNSASDPADSLEIELRATTIFGGLFTVATPNVIFDFNGFNAVFAATTVAFESTTQIAKPVGSMMVVTPGEGNTTLFTSPAADLPQMVLWEGRLRLNNDMAVEEYGQTLSDFAILDLNGQTLTTRGDAIFGLGDFEVSGAASTLTVEGSFSTSIDMIGSVTWYLNVTGDANANSISVQNSDASGGSEVQAIGSADLGGNLNWNFGASSNPFAESANRLSLGLGLGLVKIPIL